MLKSLPALLPVVALAAAVAVAENRPAEVQRDPEAGATASERPQVKGELRPGQDGPIEKRPNVRVILPSPYGGRP